MLPAIMAALASTALSKGIDAFNSTGGSGGRHEQRSRLDKKQIPLYDQLQEANMNPGAGGSFGTAADYYRDLLSNDSQTMEQLSAPEMRRFNEETIPGISEQFAGMGSGGLSSSGFQNAAVGAGTDLSERLGAIRANLRAQGAQGLTNIGQIGLDNYTNNTYQQDAPGFFESAAPGIGQGITAMAYDYLNKPGTPKTPSPTSPLSSKPPDFSYKGQSSPYGNY